MKYADSAGSVRRLFEISEYCRSQAARCRSEGSCVGSFWKRLQDERIDSLPFVIAPVELRGAGKRAYSHPRRGEDYLEQGCVLHGHLVVRQLAAFNKWHISRRC